MKAAAIRGRAPFYGAPKRLTRLVVCSHRIYRTHVAEGVRLVTACGRPVVRDRWHFVSRGCFDSLPCKLCRAERDTVSRGRWGRGWDVGIRKAISEHERALDLAAPILAQECGTRHEPGARADLCPKCQSFEKGKTPPMNRPDHTLRGIAPSASAGAHVQSEADKTRTLRGLGLIRNTLRGLGEQGDAVTRPPASCPACAIKHEPVAVDLAICYGVALVFVQRADPAQGKLCEMHRRLLRLLVDEIKIGPKRVGDGDTWDD
ncbi:MAG: hypothetical protein ACRDNM_00065 [Gaiellaceae bacterium]